MLARPLHDVQCVVAASVLVLASGCKVTRAPHAHAPAAIQQAASAPPVASVANAGADDQAAKQADTASCSPDQGRATMNSVTTRAPSAAAVTGAEAEYLSAKQAYIACLTADQTRGIPDSMLSVREAAALHDLTGRLRSILGAFQAEGFSDSGAINLQTLLPGYVESGDVDGIAYRSPDSTTVLATTRTLLAAWLQSAKPSDTTTSRDSVTMLASPVVFTRAFPEDAAVIPYANIPADHAAQSGVVAAMLVMRAQDVGPGTPNEVMVSVVRGNHVLLAEAPASALIAPMPSCVSIWRAATREEDSLVAVRRSNPTAASASHQSIDFEEQGDSAGRRCYAEHVTADPRFAALEQQVRSVVRRLLRQ